MRRPFQFVQLIFTLRGTLISVCTASGNRSFIAVGCARGIFVAPRGEERE